MYPLFSWTYPDICRRLDKLIQQDFHNEAVVACAQTIEQIIKRIMQQHMSLSRLGFTKKPEKLKLIKINTKEERDNGLKRLQGLDDMKEAWKLLISDKAALLGLPELMNAVAGSTTWEIIYNRNPVKVVVSNGNFQCSSGLFRLRHKLVHGTSSPPKEDIKVLAEWGTETIKRLLDPVNGISSYIGWNPQHRISPLRKRKTP